VLVFYEENPRLVEETALPQLPLMCKGADFAVMAEIDYDEFIFFKFCLSAVSSLDCGLFFLSGLGLRGSLVVAKSLCNSMS